MRCGVVRSSTLLKGIEMGNGCIESSERGSVEGREQLV